MNIRKTLLDKILEEYEVTIVGSGYIDIIVPRKNYKNCISELVRNDFFITDISWWEHSKTDSSKYGMGGPLNRNGDGWFSELPIENDVINFSKEDKDSYIKKTIHHIEHKEFIFFGNQKITFLDYKNFTPGIWLELPDDWESIYKKSPNSFESGVVFGHGSATENRPLLRLGTDEMFQTY